MTDPKKRNDVHDPHTLGGMVFDPKTGLPTGWKLRGQNERLLIAKMKQDGRLPKDEKS